MEPYALTDLLDDRNRQLYEELAPQVPIELHPSDNSSWGEILQEGAALISYAPSSYPISCFTHELLHVHFDLLGMERPEAFEIEVATKQQLNDELERLHVRLSYLYNQLIHQKMYPLFVAMGFPAAEFLGESDAEGMRSVLEDVIALKDLSKRERRHLTVSEFIWPYIVAKSPHDSSPETERMRKDIRNLSGGASYIVDDLIRRLVADPAPNMSWYLARLFYLCGMPDVAIGRDQQHLIWARDTASGKPPAATD